MTEREKVIKGLELCSREHPMTIGCLLDCPYDNVDGCNKKLMQQALALLKAQEPHLLAEGDFIDNPRCDRNGCLPVWVEYRTGHCGWTKTSAETMYVGMFARGRQKYRYWTDKPTMEQMEATPWK